MSNIISKLKTKHKFQWIYKLLVLIISLGLMRGMSFILLPFYTRILTVEDYGIMDLCLNYLSMANLIMDIGLSTYASILFFKVTETETNVVIKKIIEVFMTWSCCILVLLTIFSPLVNTFLFDRELNVLILLVMNLSACLGFFNSLLFVLLRCKDKIGLLSIVQFSLTFVNLICNILFIYIMKLGFIGAIYSQLTMNVISLVINILLFKEYYSFRLLKSWNLVFETVGKSAPYAMISFIAFLVYGLDRWIISIYLDTHSLGIYALAYKVASLFDALVLYLIATIYSPSVYRSYRDNGVLSTEKKNKKVITVYTLGGVSTIILCYWILKSPFLFLVGSKFAESYEYIFLIMLGYVFMGTANMSSYILYFKEKNKQILFAYIIGSLINILMLLLLIKPMGLFGVALSTTGSYLGLALYMYATRKTIIKETNVDEIFKTL